MLIDRNILQWTLINAKVFGNNFAWPKCSQSKLQIASNTLQFWWCWNSTTSRVKRYRKHISRPTCDRWWAVNSSSFNFCLTPVAHEFESSEVFSPAYGWPEFHFHDIFITVQLLMSKNVFCVIVNFSASSIHSPTTFSRSTVSYMVRQTNEIIISMQNVDGVRERSQKERSRKNVWIFAAVYINSFNMMSCQSDADQRMNKNGLIQQWQRQNGLRIQCNGAGIKNVSNELHKSTSTSQSDGRTAQLEKLQIYGRTWFTLLDLEREYIANKSECIKSAPQWNGKCENSRNCHKRRLCPIQCRFATMLVSASRSNYP